jgi:hypothetical protein
MLVTEPRLGLARIGQQVGRPAESGPLSDDVGPGSSALLSYWRMAGATKS